MNGTFGSQYDNPMGVVASLPLSQGSVPGDNPVVEDVGPAPTTGGQGGPAAVAGPPSFFDEFVESNTFQLLRCKHTLADLVHDYGKPFLTDNFTKADRTSSIIDRILPGVPDADRATLEDFFGRCTTDAAAKKAFYSEVETFLFANNKNLEQYKIHEHTYEDTSVVNSVFQHMRNNYNTGELYWYLDSQSGNIIRDYEKFRGNPIPFLNKFCEDAATTADPASGLNPTKIPLRVHNSERNPLLIPAANSSLGLTLQLEKNPADTKYVRATWEGRPPIDIRGNEKTTSIENVMDTILGLPDETDEDKSIRLDWLLLKTSGDRAQAYACNNAYGPDVTPIFKTLDILASYDAMFYMKCPVLVSGPNNVKFYQFRGVAEETLSGIDATSLTTLNNRLDKQSHIDKLFVDAKSEIDTYFQNVMGYLEVDKVPRFPSGAITPQPTSTGNGFLYVLIDTLEKMYYYQLILDKCSPENIRKFYDITPIPAADAVAADAVAAANNPTYPAKYKPLLSPDEMRNYLRTDLFYEKACAMYSKLANIFTRIQDVSMRTERTFLYIKDLCFQEIRNVLRAHVTSDTCPINIIALFVTVLMLQMTIPARPSGSRDSRSGQGPLLNYSIDKRLEWIEKTLNHPALRRTFALMFRELLDIDVKDGAGIITRYQPVTARGEEEPAEASAGPQLPPTSLSAYTIHNIQFKKDIELNHIHNCVPLLRNIVALSYKVVPDAFRISEELFRPEDIQEFRIGTLPPNIFEALRGEAGPLPAATIASINIRSRSKKSKRVKNASQAYRKTNPRALFATFRRVGAELQRVANSSPREYRLSNPDIRNLKKICINTCMPASFWNYLFRYYYPGRQRGGGVYPMEELDYPFFDMGCDNEDEPAAVPVATSTGGMSNEEDEEMAGAESDSQATVLNTGEMHDDEAAAPPTIASEDMHGISPCYGYIYGILESIDNHIQNNFSDIHHIVELSQLIADSILTGAILYNSQEPGDNIYLLAEVSQFLDDVYNLANSNYSEISKNNEITAILESSDMAAERSSSGRGKREREYGPTNKHSYFKYLFNFLLESRFVSNIPFTTDFSFSDDQDNYYYGIPVISAFINEEMREQKFKSTDDFIFGTPVHGTPTHIASTYESPMSMSTTNPTSLTNTPSRESVGSESIPKKFQDINVFPIEVESKIGRRLPISDDGSTINDRLHAASGQTTNTTGGSGGVYPKWGEAPVLHTLLTPTKKQQLRSQSAPDAATLMANNLGGGGRRTSRRRQRKRTTYKKKRASQKRRTYRRHH